MFSVLQAVHTLQKEGKLHKALVIRTLILSAISLILICVATYNVITRGINPYIALGLFAGGFLFGLFVFARMNVIQWNEEREVIRAGRMDGAAFAVLGLYIALEIALRTVLKDAYPGSFTATALLFATIGGTLLGRSLGTILAIHQVSQEPRVP